MNHWSSISISRPYAENQYYKAVHASLISLLWTLKLVISMLCNVTSKLTVYLSYHDVIKWKHFPRYWWFVRGIHRPVTRSFGGFFDLRLNNRLSKKSWGWWFETPSFSLWHHCNDKRDGMIYGICRDPNASVRNGFVSISYVYSGEKWIRCNTNTAVSFCTIWIVAGNLFHWRRYFKPSSATVDIYLTDAVILLTLLMDICLQVN